MQHAPSLQLDRRLQNHAFESWKTGRNFVASRSSSELPGSVFQGAADAVDFAHTRAALLCNHLFCSQGRLFTVTAAGGGLVLRVDEVLVQQQGQQAVPGTAHVADIPLPAGDAAVAPTDAALHCSLAVLATAHSPQQPAAHAVDGGTAAAAAAAAAAAGGSGFQALVSSGRGDLVLLTHTPGQPGVVSAPVYPLRPRAPAVGAKPFTLLTAWLNPAGRIRAVLTCLTDTAAASSSGSSSKSAWVCETWVVTLSASETPHTAGDSTPQQQQQQQVRAQLQVLDCQLLLVSRSPPAAAVAAAAAAAADRVLLVGEPGLEEPELPAGYKPQLAAALGLPDAPAPAASAAAPMDTDTPAAAPPTPPTAAGLGSNPSAAAGTAPGAAAAAAGGGGMECDNDEEQDGDDIDPRTLAAAAARLAKYMSEMEVGDLPQQQWSDVFKESGPGDLGAGGSEPAVDVLLFGPPADPLSSSSNSSNSGTAAVGKLTLKCTASCGPHKLLCADGITAAVGPGAAGGIGAAGPGVGGPGAGSEPSLLLLGLTDDVDCAVITAAFSNTTTAAATAGAATAAAAAAATAAAAAAAAAGGSSGGDLVLRHAAFLPAIAYVVAGKTQRRHLLLAPQAASSPVCCALVEGSKYTYLYGQVPQGSTYGQQQIVDMELPEGQSILGARLLQLPNSSSSSSTEGAGAGAGVVLLLLTQSQLICYQLQEPA